MSRKPSEARSLGRADWILSYFSLRGASFEDRLEAARAAGFAGVGLLIPEYQRLRSEGRSDAEPHAWLALAATLSGAASLGTGFVLLP